jgi:hypothetical protein
MYDEFVKRECGKNAIRDHLGEKTNVFLKE